MPLSPTTADENNNRRRTLPEPSRLSPGILHCGEGTVADCLMLYTQHASWDPISSVVAQLVHAKCQP